MEFRLLGSFEAGPAGEPVVVGRRQERLLLAILLLEAGHAVAIDRLADLLWDGEPPPSARGTLHTYVGRLRTALAPYGAGIVTRGSGYAVEGAEVDAARFTDLARAAAATSDLAERVRLGGAALALWRGPLLADLAGESLRRRLGGPLTDLRLATAEAYARVLLDMGHHERVALDLAALAGAHPTREGLVAHVMTALYRAARQADALALYDLARKALATGSGVEPGVELETVHQRILAGDPRLERPAAPVYAVRVRDLWLPWSVGGHPALELCNTYAGWGGERQPGAEWLRGYPTLAVWAGHQDLLDDATVTQLVEAARRDPLGAAVVLDETRELRARLYACLTRPEDAKAFAAVVPYVEAAAAVSVFRRAPDGLGRWRPAPSAGLRAPLHAAARSAGELLADRRRLTVCACSSPTCGWLFVDHSGRRRWCSTATCGDHPK
ncbi:BTAD domain-containing putative transcriptional regulator [Phytohabitans sp. ZYX-F-186]|uniref:BTAD domain-containing putative transcriptional regulator n=1 Tax=Phytohabitans maris TaxID=3071409 RepID=A0ABU0ZD50_9ACTN|nr:BTAD domain-containing putative transcriptional regulator [Phytohabitans sp. ZYX-F-186]MDQ7904359.1 BTAD domain-containing putative transcriptional regulator [Phytohabitans sp. ZYX-F-186]